MGARLEEPRAYVRARVWAGDKFSQKDMAEKFGVSPSTINRWVTEYTQERDSNRQPQTAPDLANLSDDDLLSFDYSGLSRDEELITRFEFTVELRARGIEPPRKVQPTKSGYQRLIDLWSASERVRKAYGRMPMAVPHSVFT